MDDEYAFLEAAVDGRVPPAAEDGGANGAEHSKPRDSSRSRDREGGVEKERSSKEKRRHRRCVHVCVRAEAGSASALI